MAKEYFLSGDIGGTKTLLQLNLVNDEHTPILRKSYQSTAYKGLTEIVEEFLTEADIKKITAACFALAGPINGRVVKLTNLPWVVDADAMATHFSISRVVLINDFEAVGYGVNSLQASELLTLQAGSAQDKGTRLVVGAGTGLGVAWLTWQDGRYKVSPSEAGHMDFAPIDEMQSLLLRYLQTRYEHVSYERIVSGPGMCAIFEFVRDSGLASPSEKLTKAMEEGDAAAVITQFALQGNEQITRMTVDLFLAVYGAFVGNLGLAILPLGGIYVAGGIAAKINTQMQSGLFLNAFLFKGRFKELLAKLPVHVVLNTNVGLLGAYQYARQFV
jgi:glucokinase